MRLVSINVARPRTVRWRGQDVRTSIHKEPVEGRRMATPAQPRRRRAGQPHGPRRRASRGLRLPARVLPPLGARARPQLRRLSGASARTSPSTAWPCAARRQNGPSSSTS